MKKETRSSRKAADPKAMKAPLPKLCIASEIEPRNGGERQQESSHRTLAFIGRLGLRNEIRRA